MGIGPLEALCLREGSREFADFELLLTNGRIGIECRVKSASGRGPKNFLGVGVYVQI